LSKLAKYGVGSNWCYNSNLYTLENSLLIRVAQDSAVFVSFEVWDKSLAWSQIEHMDFKVSKFS
jgi:hypothetical protein